MASGPGPREITDLLRAWARGERRAIDRLVPLVLDELRRIAAACLKDERTGHTLRPTALVNELYLRLSRGTPADLQDRSAFFQFATQTIRRILIDYSRARATEKRKGRAQSVSLDLIGELLDPPPDIDVLALHEALERLEQLSPRRSKIVELRFFGGLSLEEIAETLGVSASTVSREWVGARAWLFRELS
jgi:RNA polymerase sigma factor (TIGR02999 family)